jgi:hypothetical protein
MVEVIMPRSRRGEVSLMKMGITTMAMPVMMNVMTLPIVNWAVVVAVVWRMTPLFAPAC